MGKVSYWGDEDARALVVNTASNGTVELVIADPLETVGALTLARFRVEQLINQLQAHLDETE